MGVKDLNIILNNCVQESIHKHHNVVIIDGSNLIFQTLTSQLGKMKKNNIIIKQWGSFDLPLLSQIVFIIQNTINDISNLINKHLENGVEKIFIVMDPGKTPCYKINTKMSYNHKYEHLITNDDSLSKGETIEVNIKVAEQEARRKRNSKADSIQKEINYIRQLKDSQNLTDEEIEILIKIFKQSFYLNNNTELLRLSWIVLKNIDLTFRNRGIKIVDAIDEADLVIKNIANEFNEETNILVLSMDTDYNILFADMPNVDVASLMRSDVIHNPNKCWKQILGKAFSYETVIRLSPILGNDYTVREPIISAKNYEDLLSLLNVNGKFNSLKQSTRKKIYKVVDGIKPPDGIIDLEYLDEIIYEWNEEYFKKYYLSNIIYGNWMVYNRYNILEQQDEVSIESEINLSLRKILVALEEKYDENETITLYQWNSTFLFNDWNEFFNTLDKKTFKSYEDFLDYYYEYEINNVEEGCEFIE